MTSRGVTRELGEAVERATSAGVAPRVDHCRSRPWVRQEGGAQLQSARSHRRDLAALDRPILAGPSRKSFLTAALGERAPDEREWATAAAVTASVLFGAHIVRVHGVAAMADVVRVADRIRDGDDATIAEACVG